ncbi:hypothetical protein D3C76_524010 [compost metagenome]
MVTAFWKSALREMMVGDLPPSSRVTGTRFSAAARITCLPMLVAPVNSRWSNGCEQNAWPVSGPPVITATSSSANTERIMRAISSEVFGVNSEGLIITRLPAARAPARPLKARFTGKFHGLTMPITPSGWYSTQASPRSVWRGSGFIQPATWALLCFSTISGESTSVTREKSLLR